MKFVDQARIWVASGKGGNGAIAGRREKYEAFGGPAWGNGGKWGSVVLKASDDENTLLSYKYKVEYVADAGGAGEGRQKYGKNASDIFLTVPVGTIVKHSESGDVLYQLTKDGEEFVVAKGGQWGVGNMHFATPTNQFPQFGLLGEPGHQFFIDLEVSLIGDVALIGTPSVGKSTLINAVSNTKAKVADYPFTTLVPHLGEVDVQGAKFCVMDVPGLIEGAGEGKGLGADFLRHILKAKVFSFLVDVSRYDEGMDEFGQLFGELVNFVQERFMGSSEYGDFVEDCRVIVVDEQGYVTFRVEVLMDGEWTRILDKAMSFVVSKQDLLNDEEIIAEFVRTFHDRIEAVLQPRFEGDDLRSLLDSSTQILSAATHHGVKEWLFWCKQCLDHKWYAAPVAIVEQPVIYDGDGYGLIQQTKFRNVSEEKLEELFEQWLLDRAEEKEKKTPTKVFPIVDTTICRLAYMTMWERESGEHRFWQTLDREGVLTNLKKNGFQFGDILWIQSPYEGMEDRYLRW